MLTPNSDSRLQNVSIKVRRPVVFGCGCRKKDWQSNIKLNIIGGVVPRIRDEEFRMFPKGYQPIWEACIVSLRAIFFHCDTHRLNPRKLYWIFTTNVTVPVWLGANVPANVH